jgi:hypothetical protein
MNLFYGQTTEEQLKNLKKDIKSWAISAHNYDYGHKRIYLAFGQKETIGNNCLFISSPFAADSAPFEDKDYSFLKNTAQEFGIINYFLTPHFLIPKEIVTRANIKEYSKFMEAIVDIIQPRLIVVLGENSVFSFFNKKFILRDWHGKLIGKTIQGIDVIISYSPSYYTERSDYEDPSFKKFILNNDWNFISKLYKERIVP